MIEKQKLERILRDIMTLEAERKAGEAELMFGLLGCLGDWEGCHGGGR